MSPAAAEGDISTHSSTLLPPGRPIGVVAVAVGSRAGAGAHLGELDLRRLIPCPPPPPRWRRDTLRSPPLRLALPVRKHHLVHPPAQRIQSALPPITTITTNALSNSLPTPPPSLSNIIQQHPQYIPGVQPPCAVVSSAPIPIPVPAPPPRPLHKLHHHRLAPVARVRVRHLPLTVAPPLPLDETEDTVVNVVSVAPPPAVVPVRVSAPPPIVIIV